MSSTPKVSVILPVYNPERKWLNEAIESVLSQSYGNLELVVVNDGSKENIDFYIDNEFLNRSELRTFYQDNKGFTGATNRAVEEAKGKYIAPIGDDDFWRENKLEKQVTKIQEKEGDLIFNKVEAIDKNGKLVKYKGIFPETDRSKNLLTEGVYPGYESLLIRAEIFKALKMSNEYYIASDLDLWMRTFPKYKILYIDEALTKKRLHDDNISRDHLETLREVETIYQNYIDNFKLSGKEKRAVFSNLYRRKGKGLYQDESKNWEARRLWLKSLSLYPDLKSFLLLILSFNSNIYEKANSIYSRD
jgi:glycosyltransferase involved in cell wall biosynthesis